MIYLFLPASLGLLWQIVWGESLAHQGLALGALIFCLDQARMAALDWQQIAEVRQQVSDSRLERFRLVVIATIGLELAGFYLASQWLGWGGLIVLASQLWFNTFATIQLQPTATPPIIDRPWADRGPILIADAVVLGLLGLWIADIGRLGIVATLWGMAILYGLLKYVFLNRSTPATPSDRPPT